MIARLPLPLLLIALVVLAGLQYQWIGQISLAEREHLERTVRESSHDVAEDFAGEIRSLHAALEGRPGMSREPASIASRYRDWADAAGYPNLVRALYWVRSAGDLNRIDLDLGTADPTTWPPELVGIEVFLGRRGQTLPHLEGVDALLIPAGPLDGPRRDRGREFFGDRTLREERGPWPEPRGSFTPPGRGGGPPPGPWSPPETWLIAELNHDVIVNEILPSLVARHFPDSEGSTYRVAVVSMAQNEPRVIFTNGTSWSSEELSTPDGAVDLFGAGGYRGPGPRRGRAGPPGPAMPAFVGQNWRLLVKHQAGSLEIAATRFRNRNLAISFGILIVLGIGAMTMAISGHRAHRLGKLQMEFAAGVSHELRTPLTVIQSAAHNLGAGIVRDREGIEEYAAIVQKEARRLSDMVEQVMAYTETQSGRKRYDMGPIDVDDVVESAIGSMAIALGDGNAVIEKSIEPDLPPVMADAAALTRCVQNLLSNAVKYGRGDDSACIEVKAVLDTSSRKVRLSVIDQGPGVPQSDVRHLFEAFHRGANAATNTPGNGLGLHLVHKMMSAQEGSVSYQQTPAGGAAFTLALSAADHNA